MIKRRVEQFKWNARLILNPLLYLFWTQTFEHPLEYHSLADQTSLQKQSTSASRDTIILSPDLEQTIRIFCEEHKINIISLFMASFYICISRITSKKDLAIGTYYGNRGSKAEKEMLGMFVSSLPIQKAVPCLLCGQRKENLCQDQPLF